MSVLRCSSCRGAYRYDTVLTNAQWNRVVRQGGPEHDHELLCASCIIGAFVDAGEEFAAEVICNGQRGRLVLTLSRLRRPAPREGGGGEGER